MNDFQVVIIIVNEMIFFMYFIINIWFIVNFMDFMDFDVKLISFAINYCKMFPMLNVIEALLNFLYNFYCFFY